MTDPEDFRGGRPAPAKPRPTFEQGQLEALQSRHDSLLEAIRKRAMYLIGSKSGAALDEAKFLISLLDQYRGAP